MVSPARLRTVQNTVEVPGSGGAPYANKTIRIKLNTPGFIDNGSTEKLFTRRTSTNSLGLWSLALEVNADIDPPGTSYTVCEGPDVYWTFVVTAGTGVLLLRNAIVVSPTNPTPMVAGVPMPVNQTPGNVATVAADGNSVEWDTPSAVAGGVTTFNTRSGPVSLTKLDVTSTGLAAADIGAQPADSDLSAIALLDASTAGAIASDGTGWIKKTYAQFKTALGLTKGDVGLANVDNTSDVNKPVSTAQQTALNLKANSASPTFTGTVTVPTPVNPADASTKQYVDSAVVGLLEVRGSYDASVNTFPTTGGSGTAGAVVKGDLWMTTVGGTLGGTPVTAGDLILALVDTPGQTAANWDLIPHDGAYVTLTGNQTVAGTKTFSSAPVVPAGSFPESAITNLVSDLAAKASTAALTAQGLTPTAVKTANYVAVAGDLVMVDATSGPITITAPTLAPGVRWGIRLTTAVANGVTASTGAGTFDTNGSTTLPMASGPGTALVDVTFSGNAAGTQWVGVSSGKPNSYLATLFLALSNFLAKGDIIAATAAGAIARHAVGADGTVLTADSSQADGLRWGSLAGLPVFGDGSDGNVTISTSISLTRDMYYDTLTVVSGGTLKTTGYRVFCRTACIVQAGGVINADGGSSVANVNGTSNTNNQASLGNEVAAPNGNSTGIGGAGNGLANSLGGSGGAGGTGTGGAGGAAGVATVPAVTLGSQTLRSFPFTILGVIQGVQNNTAVNTVIKGGASGGAGGGNGTQNAGGGGAGGSLLVLAARTVSNAGRISANGGSGGSTINSGSAGGGGGGGGAVLVTTTAYSGTTPTANGGAGGTGSGAGTNGSNGANGTVVQLVGV